MWFPESGERKLHCGYKFVEAVKGMTELAKLKSDMISWNGTNLTFILDTNLSASFKHF